MQVVTASEIIAASRRGEPEIAGVSLDRLIRSPEAWEPEFVQLRLPAARLLARVANKALREQARQPIVAEVVPAKPRARARRPRALTAGS